jgi:hypothetical protein
MAQLEQVNQTMADTATATTHRGDLMVSNLSTVSEEAKTRLAQLAEATQSSVDKYANATRQMRGHATKAGEAMEARTNALMTARNQMASAIEQLADQSHGTTIRLEQAASAIARQASSIVDAQDAMETGLDRSVQGLGQAIERLGMATETARARMNQVTSTLDGSAERIDSTSSEARDRAEEAARLFEAEADKLHKAAETAIERAETMRDMGLGIRREAFLDAAKFVIESLHALSVDFNRLIGDEIPDKVWKAYYRGDTNTFTRRLLSLRDSISTDDLRERFETDTEFRGYVQRFIRQFEELLDDAAARDHSDLLASTLMTSDVGKVYVLLCTAIGRHREPA